MPLFNISSQCRTKKNWSRDEGVTTDLQLLEFSLKIKTTPTSFASKKRNNMILYDNNDKESLQGELLQWRA